MLMRWSGENCTNSRVRIDTLANKIAQLRITIVSRDKTKGKDIAEGAESCNKGWSDVLGSKGNVEMTDTWR